MGRVALPPAACDTVVIGGGILGLATAREILVRRPLAQVVLLEAQERLAEHQTSHNSGVIHAGIYYAPGSLKARLCVDGSRRMYALCAELGVPTDRCGKLVIASRPADVPRLDELERRSAASGVRVERLDHRQLREVEPHATGLAALHSPDTGIVDYAQVADALARDIRRRGGQILTGCAVDRALPTPDGVRVEHRRGVLHAAAAVACVGAQADRLAVRGGGPADPRIIPFRGAYFQLRRPELVRGLIYPVPDPELPFLGVHLTRRIGGDVVVGPTALAVGARDAYRLRTIRLADARDTLSWPGTYRMAWRWRRHALHELGYALSVRAYARETRTLVPAVRASDLSPAFAGIRAQALDRQGGLVDDFVFESAGRVLHVRNAPSPAATSSLAIANEIVDRIDGA